MTKNFLGKRTKLILCSFFVLAGLASAESVKNESASSTLTLPRSGLLYKQTVVSLDTQKKNYLKHVAALLFENAKDWQRISIVGYSDLRRPESKTIKPSEERARLVRAELMSYNIDPERIVWKGSDAVQPYVELIVEGLVRGSDLEAQLKTLNPRKLEGY